MRGSGVESAVRTFAHLPVAAAALVLAGSAGAKGLPPERVCGESACLQIDGRSASAIVVDGNAERPMPPEGAYYRLDYSIDGSGPPYSFSHLFVTSGNFVGVDTWAAGGVRWFALYGQGLDRLRAATRDLEPFAAPEVWPESIEISSSTPAADGAEDDGWGIRPWLTAALVVLLGLAAAGILRVRSPKTA